VDFGDSQTFRRLLPEVVATGAAICDKALTRRQNLSQSSLKRWTEGIRQRRRKMPFVLAIQKILITFAAVNLTTKRHLASWLLLDITA
jgi:hypothetical protein